MAPRRGTLALMSTPTRCHSSKADPRGDVGQGAFSLVPEGRETISVLSGYCLSRARCAVPARQGGGGLRDARGRERRAEMRSERGDGQLASAVACSACSRRRTVEPNEAPILASHRAALCPPVSRAAGSGLARAEREVSRRPRAGTGSELAGEGRISDCVRGPAQVLPARPCAVRVRMRALLEVLREQRAGTSAWRSSGRAVDGFCAARHDRDGHAAGGHVPQGGAEGRNGRSSRRAWSKGETRDLLLDRDGAGPVYCALTSDRFSSSTSFSSISG